MNSQFRHFPCSILSTLQILCCMFVFLARKMLGLRQLRIPNSFRWHAVVLVPCRCAFVEGKFSLFLFLIVELSSAFISFILCFFPLCEYPLFIALLLLLLILCCTGKQDIIPCTVCIPIIYASYVACLFIVFRSLLCIMLQCLLHYLHIHLQ